MRIPEEEPLGRDDDDDDDDDNVRGRRGAIRYLSGLVWEKCGWGENPKKRAKIGKISPRSSNPNPNPVDPTLRYENIAILTLTPNANPNVNPNLKPFP